MIPEKIFHVSETPSIQLFEPRPSPSPFAAISSDVVFGISGTFLHTYLFPRDCPRISYYARQGSTAADKIKFMRPRYRFTVAIEASWLPLVERTTLYVYEFDPASFTVADAGAGYWVSCGPVKPIATTQIENPYNSLLKLTAVDIRLLPSLWPLADELATSSLHVSLIRMRHAAPR